MQYNKQLLLIVFIVTSFIGLVFGISSLYFYIIYATLPFFLVMYFIVRGLCDDILKLLLFVFLSWIFIIIIMFTTSLIDSISFAFNTAIASILIFISSFAHEIDSKCKCSIFSKKNHIFCSLLFLILIISIFYIFIFIEGFYFGYREMANNFLPYYLSFSIK